MKNHFKALEKSESKKKTGTKKGKAAALGAGFGCPLKNGWKGDNGLGRGFGRFSRQEGLTNRGGGAESGQG